MEPNMSYSCRWTQEHIYTLLVFDLHSQWIHPVIVILYILWNEADSKNSSEFPGPAQFSSILILTQSLRSSWHNVNNVIHCLYIQFLWRVLYLIRIMIPLFIPNVSSAQHRMESWWHTRQWQQDNSGKGGKVASRWISHPSCCRTEEEINTTEGGGNPAQMSVVQAVPVQVKDTRSCRNGNAS